MKKKNDFIFTGMMPKKRKTRMYDPWGYQEENNYQSSENQIELELDGLVAKATYNKDDNKIHFLNNDGEEICTIDVSEFDKSEKIIEKAWYENGKIYIKFTNGDLVTIDVEELIDENEFKGGLQVNEGVVSVLIDTNSEPYLTTSDDGVKISGVKAIDDKVDAETERAISAETRLDEKIDAVSSGSSEALDNLIEKLGYSDNDTLVRNNTNEVAFGTYNVSNTSEDASGRTIFSVGVGTSDADRKNALEVREDGSVYMWIEGDYMNVNRILAQISHEIYD